MNDDPGYFIVRKEDQDSLTDWLTTHRHKFMCNVYDRVKYAIDNDIERVKLYENTYKGRLVKRYNIKVIDLVEGSYLRNTMLKHFEREEHYDKCDTIKKWLQKN